jgi:hypothetical protein
VPEWHGWTPEQLPLFRIWRNVALRHRLDGSSILNSPINVNLVEFDQTSLLGHSRRILYYILKYIAMLHCRSQMRHRRKAPQPIFQRQKQPISANNTLNSTTSRVEQVRQMRKCLVSRPVKAAKLVASRRKRYVLSFHASLTPLTNRKSVRPEKAIVLEM